MEQNIRDFITEQPISWTLCSNTLHQVRATIQEHNPEECIRQRGETVLLNLID